MEGEEERYLLPTLAHMFCWLYMIGMRCAGVVWVKRGSKIIGMLKSVASSYTVYFSVCWVVDCYLLGLSNPVFGGRRRSIVIAEAFK